MRRGDVRDAVAGDRSDEGIEIALMGARLIKKPLFSNKAASFATSVISRVPNKPPGNRDLRLSQSWGSHLPDGRKQRPIAIGDA